MPATISIKPMLKPLFNDFLQHLMQQNTAIAAQLMPYAGQHITIQVLLLEVHLLIQENGFLMLAPDSSQPDAKIIMNPSTLMRLMSGDHAASHLVKIEGDSELALRVSQIIRHLRWDLEQDLSLLIGDIPAHQLGRFQQAMRQYGKNQMHNLAQMLTEYWQEEQPLLAKQHHVSHFVSEVDRLREDCARLEKRVQRLSAESERG